MEKIVKRGYGTVNHDLLMWALHECGWNAKADNQYDVWHRIEYRVLNSWLNDDI